jgi:CRP-like cAMP-binding protein
MTASEVAAAVQELKPRFLEGLAPPGVKTILEAASQRRYVANSVVTNQEHPAEHLFLLLKGRARYFFNTPDGKKTVLLWIPPGDIFGGAAFLSKPFAYLVSAETVRNSTVLVWDRATIRRLAVQRPQLVENSLLIAFDYLVAYRALHIAMSHHSARQRLAAVLVNLASGIGHEVVGGVELNINN